MVAVGVGCDQHFNVIDTLLSDIGNDSRACRSPSSIDQHIETIAIIENLEIPP